MIIDSHQHFWKYNPVRDAWIDDSMQSIRRDFLPKDLKPVLDNNGVDGCVAVQADQSESETAFLLDLAKNNEFIKGVVGWVDLRADNVEERLSFYSQYSKFKGVRHILQAEKPDFFYDKAFLNGLGKLAQFKLTYDVLIYHNQLKDAIEMMQKFPDQKFIIDHIAKPDIKRGMIKDWSDNLRIVAENKNVYCKISGMFTENHWKNWDFDDFLPYLDVVFESFGTDRVVFGSDWPVCLLAVKYETQLQFVKEYMKKYSSGVSQKVMASNALDFYNLTI